MIPAFKILFLALVFFALAPLQWLAVRFGWRLAGMIPVVFHRIAARMLGLRIVEIGKAAMERPLLIVSNHTSWIDIVTLSACAPLSFIAKSEVAGWPVVKTLARLQRTVFVDRARRSATGRAASAIGDRLAAGDPMVLFAEGTTSDGHRTLPYRSALIGAAQAMEGDGAFIQPAVVAYRRRNGLPLGRPDRAQVAWHGHMDLAPHLWALLGGGTLEGVVVWGEVRPAGAASDRKRLAAELEAWAAGTYAAAIHGRRFPDRARDEAPILNPGRTA